MTKKLTPIAFVVSGVAQEDTPSGLRGELMGRGGDDVRITCTTEDAKVLIRGCGAKESDMRAGSTYRLREEMIQQICGGVEPLGPIALDK
jgi:hypothetical protein